MILIRALKGMRGKFIQLNNMLVIILAALQLKPVSECVHFNVSVRSYSLEVNNLLFEQKGNTFLYPII